MKKSRSLLTFAVLFAACLLLPAALHAQQGTTVWTQATANAGWSARNGHASITFDGKIWVLGGYDGTYKNDVWYSTDGVTWTQATASAAWTARDYHASVVFDNKMWVLGGYNGSVDYSFFHDVWYSTDGVTWTQATASAAWAARNGHTSVVFDGKIWVIGGNTPSNYRNDVWYSSDGVNWTQATNSAGWTARCGHTSVVFDNKMWVLGGYDGSDRNDVWYSTDGVNWAEATGSAGWTARSIHTSVVSDNKMWVLGGYDGSDRNDVWYSSDGVNWTQATASAAWSARYAHSSVASNGKMWVLGGRNDAGGLRNDVWYSTSIAVTSPNGGETWPGGSSKTIRWRTAGSGFARYRLLLSRNGGSTYPDTVAPNVAPTETTYSWLVPALNLSTCRVMVQILDAGGSVIVQDASDANFTIQTAATVVSPNGGETWPGGSNQTIKWHTVGSGFARYRLLLSRNGGSTYPDTVAPNVAPTETTFGWHVPTLNLNTCRVMVQILDAGGGVISQDASNANFTIQTATTVVSPNGGEAWAGGSSQTIKWRTIGAGFARYRLLLSTNAGSTYPDTVAPNVAPTETTYNWTVSSVNSLTCRVKVQILDGLETLISEDPSDANFEVDSRLPAPVRDLQTVGERPLRSATLGWTAPGDDSMTGTASGYDIRYALSPINDSSWQYANQCTGEPAPSTPGTWQTYTVTNLQVDRRYYFAMKAWDNVQNWSLLSNVPSCSTSSPILASSQYPMFRYGLQHTGRSPHNGAQSSDLRWFYNTAQPIISSPVVAPDTTIYVVSENDTLYAITPDGTRRWSYYLGQGTQSVPAIASDSTICVGDSQGNLVVFPRNLSSPLWRYHTGGSILSSPAIGNDGVIYVGSNDGYLYAINPDSTLKWRHNIGAAVRSSPAISPDSTIYVGADDGKLYAISPSNAEKWNVAMPAALYSSPLVGPDGTVYVGCLNGKLFAVDSQGTVKWSFTTGDSIVSSPAIDAGGRIFFGSCDHCVYAIEDSGSYAKSVWRYQTSGAVRSSPSISAQGTVYIGSDDGNIYALKGSDSTVVWTRTTGSAVRSSPAIGANGTVYVGSDDGRLYAIGYASGIEEREAAARLEIPASDILCHGEPNPFVLRTTIRFGLSRAGRASLKVYSTAGAVVRTLVSESKSPGYYTASWNGIDDRGRSVPAGIYVCRLQTAEIQTTMIMAKLK